MPDIEPQTDEIRDVINRYIENEGEEFPLSNGYTLDDMVESIYQHDSEVWKKYAGQTVSDKFYLDEFQKSLIQKNLLDFLMRGPEPTYKRINKCLQFIVDIHAIVEKYILAGVYSEEQGIVLVGILLTDFARVLDSSPAKIWKADFSLNKPAVALYNKLWAPYEKYLISVGQMKLEAHNIHHQGKGNVLEQLAHENIKKTGCSVFLLLPVVAVLCKIFFK